MEKPTYIIADLAAANRAPVQSWELIRWGNGYTDAAVTFELVGSGMMHIVASPQAGLPEFRHGNTIPVTRADARRIWAGLVAKGFKLFA